jgi:ATP-dependent Lhr-like helicase
MAPPVQVEDAARADRPWLVSCDGFAPLRRLLAARTSLQRRRPGSARVVRGGSAAGRAGFARRARASPPIRTTSPLTARGLLLRHGASFRDSAEARGLVRGGRFVTGFTGEQFALPEAIPPLRRARSKPDEGAIVRVSAADPLNLVGILTPGPRVPAGHTRWVIFRDGLPIAVEDRDGRSELAPTG